MKVTILHRVRVQLLASAQWYDAQRGGLGSEFLAAVDLAVLAVQNAPYRFPVVFKDARRVQLERFPYGVFYVLRHDQIYVYSVSHLHGDPRQWQRAIPK